ncbi:MAG: hypothetical protein OXH81_06330 [Gemmatimonadetes bacterium]|nr:hypothetical protein [Gemmatimonadota bacterium]MDE2735072.1 hypothetical protein [Gemmatimonadota bacterium]
MRLACGWASLLLPLLAGQPACATEVEADSTRTAQSGADTLLSAHGALLRSAVLPGWGQFYNGRPVKGLFFGVASATALTAVAIEHRRIRSAPTPEEHQDRTARRNGRLLYFALSVALAAIDAYVDAHLADFGAVQSGLSVEMWRGRAWLRLKKTMP